MTRLVLPAALIVACAPRGDACDGAATEVACDATAPADTDTDTDADTDADSDTDADTGEEIDTVEARIEALLGSMVETGRCETDPAGVRVRGFERYEYVYVTGDRSVGLSGWYGWKVFANGTWEGAGGADCEVTWDGTITGIAGGTRDVGVQLDVAVDAARTTCGPTLYAGREAWLAALYFDFLADGGATMYDASDEVLGSGYYTESVMIGVTTGECVFPPSL